MGSGGMLAVPERMVAMSGMALQRAVVNTFCSQAAVDCRSPTTPACQRLAGGVPRRGYPSGGSQWVLLPETLPAMDLIDLWPLEGNNSLPGRGSYWGRQLPPSAGDVRLCASSPHHYERSLRPGRAAIPIFVSRSRWRLLHRGGAGGPRP